MQQNLEDLFNISKFTDLFPIKKYPTLPVQRAPYLMFLQTLFNNSKKDPQLILLQFLHTYNISQQQFILTQEFATYLNKIHQQNNVFQTIPVFQYIVQVMPFSEDYDFDEIQNIQEVFNLIISQGLKGVINYARDNLSPDVLEDFEEGMRHNQFPQLLDFVDYVNGTVLDNSDLSMSLPQKQPHNVDESFISQTQGVQQQELQVLNLKQLEILFDQLCADLKLKVKKDEKYMALLQQFQEDIQIYNQQFQNISQSVQQAGQNFAAKKIAKKFQETFSLELCNRYPGAQQQQNNSSTSSSMIIDNNRNMSSYNQQSAVKQSYISNNQSQVMDQSQYMSQSQRQPQQQQQQQKFNPNLYAAHNLQAVDDNEYKRYLYNEQKALENFMSKYKQITHDSDEEPKEGSQIKEQNQVPSDQISDEEKEKKTSSWFQCGGGKPKPQNTMILGGDKLGRFPQEWCDIQPIEILQPKFLKRSENWLRVFMKWKTYFNREKITDQKIKKYIAEMEKLASQFRYKDQFKYKFLLIAQFKQFADRSQELTNYLTSLLIRDLYLGKKQIFDIYKIIPIIQNQLKKPQLADQYILDHLVDYDWKNLIIQNSFMGVQQAILSYQILEILNKNTQIKILTPEILLYCQFYHNDKQLYKLFSYLVECKGQENQLHEYIYYFEALINKNINAAVQFILYNLAQGLENSQQYFQSILEKLAFKIPGKIEQVIGQLDGKLDTPEIIKYSNFYETIGDEIFHLLKKNIICKQDEQLFPIFQEAFKELLQLNFNAALHLYLNNQTKNYWPQLINSLSLQIPLEIQDLIKNLELQMKQPEILSYIQFFQSEKTEHFPTFREMIYSKNLLEQAQQQEEQQQNIQPIYDAFLVNFQKVLVYKQKAALLFIEKNPKFSFYKQMFNELAYIIPKLLSQFFETYDIQNLLKLNEKPEPLNYVEYFEQIKDQTAILLFKLIHLKKVNKTQSQEFSRYFQELVKLYPLASIQFIQLNRQIPLWNDILENLSFSSPIECDQVVRNFPNFLNEPIILQYIQFYTVQSQLENEQNQLNLLQDQFNFVKQLLQLQNQPQQQEQLFQFIFQNLQQDQYFEILIFFMIQNRYPKMQQIIDQMSVQNPELTQRICKEIQINNSQIKIDYPETTFYSSHINQDFTHDDLKDALDKFSKLKKSIHQNKKVPENKSKLFKKLIKKLQERESQSFAVEWITNNQFTEFSYSELLEEASMENMELCKLTKNIHSQLQQSNLKQQQSQIKLTQSQLKRHDSTNSQQSQYMQQSQAGDMLSSKLQELDTISSQLKVPDLVQILEENPQLSQNQFSILSQLQKQKMEFLQNKQVQEIKDRYFRFLIKALENRQEYRQTTEIFLQKNFSSLQFSYSEQNEFLQKLSIYSLEMLQYTPEFFQKTVAQYNNNDQTYSPERSRLSMSKQPSTSSQQQQGKISQKVSLPELTLYIQEIQNNQSIFRFAQELQQQKQIKQQQNQQQNLQQSQNILLHSNSQQNQSLLRISLSDLILQNLQRYPESSQFISKWLKINALNNYLQEEQLQNILDEISQYSLQMCESSFQIYNSVKSAFSQQKKSKPKIFGNNNNNTSYDSISGSQLYNTTNNNNNQSKIKVPEMAQYIDELQNSQELFKILKDIVNIKKQCLDLTASYDRQRNQEMLDQKIIYHINIPNHQKLILKFLQINSANFDWTNFLNSFAQKDPNQAYQLYQQMRQYNQNIEKPVILEFLPYFDQDPHLQQKISTIIKLSENTDKIQEFESSLKQLSSENYDVYRKFMQLGIVHKNNDSMTQSQIQLQQQQNVVFFPNYDLKESFQVMEEFYGKFKFCQDKRMSQNILQIFPRLIFCPGKDLQTQKYCQNKFTNINNLPNLKCPTCSYNFCSMCYQPTHSQQTCEQVYESLQRPQKIQQEKEFQRQKQLQQSENENRKKQEILQWIQQKKDFSCLNNIFFNLVNRGDDWESIIKSINQELKKQNIFLPFSFNRKLLLYLYLQNSDEIRQYKSIEQHARYNDVPLFYPKWPSNVDQTKFYSSMHRLDYSSVSSQQNQQIQQQQQFLFSEYTINTAIYLITQPSTSILSFGISKSATQPTGKSSILNYVFDKNFQTDDRSPFSARTIDIDFDNSFRPTRSLAIADVNGVFEKKHHAPFFNLFQFLILHIKFKDLQQDSKTLKELQDIIVQLQQSPLKPILYVIVRDYPQHQMQDRQYIDLDQQSTIQKIQQFQVGQALLQYPNTHICLMENLERVTVKEEKIQVLDELKNSILSNLQRIVDKKALNKKSILEFFKHYNDAVEIEQIDKIKSGIMQELYKYQNDFFDQHIFPCRDLMKKVKHTKQQIWKGTNKQQINNYQYTLKQLESKLAQAPLSQIMKQFLQEVLASPNWYKIIIDLSREISTFSFEKLTELKKEKEIIQKKYEQILNLANEEEHYEGNYVEDRLKLEDQKNKANERVEQQIISIEIFWRELFSLLEFNDQVLADSQIDPLERMFDFSGYGESFEIIDGDNMQVNKNQLSQLAEKFKQSRILVLSILGPQSSGKSTLLNYLFGCQFSSSVGRCTRGVYGSLVKVDRDHLNKILQDLSFQGFDRKTIDEKAFDYLLVLDTEGLQDPAKPNTEFDRTITLFCFSVSQILLINFKGEVTREMKKLLEICVYSLHTLRKTRIIGNEVYMVFNQNAHVNDITPLKEQITNMKSNIIEANKKAASEAELLCSGRDGQVVALGSAFKEDQFPASEYVWEQWKKKIPQSSFAMDCQALAENIFGGLLRQKAEWNFSSWLKMAQGIWNFIELYPGILEFEDIMQLKQENDFREEIEIQKKQLLQQRPTDVVQEQIRIQQEKYGKSNLVEIYEHVKQYIGEMYNEANVLIHNNLTQFCEERNLDVKLLKNKLQQIKDYISNQEKEAMFHLSDYLQKGKTNSYKKEGIVSINEKIKQYQQNFPYQEIDEYLFKKYKKQRNQLSQDQYNMVIQEWSEYKFEQLWTRIIDDLVGKLNLEENCYDLIYNHLEEFYKKKEKNIVTTHFKHKVKDILLSNHNEKLSVPSLLQLQDFFIRDIIKDKNQIIFKKKITEKFDQNLNLILRQLDRHGNFLNLKNVFKIKVQRRYLQRKNIHYAFNAKKLKDMIQKSTSQISITANSQTKERVASQLITGLQGMFYTMGVEIQKQAEAQVYKIFQDKYVSESSRANDVFQALVNQDNTPKIQILQEGGGFNYKQLKKNYAVYSFFPDFEKCIEIMEWEYNDIDVASDQLKNRQEQIQKQAQQLPTALFDQEEYWLYFDTFNTPQKKIYEQGVQFLITKDIGLGSKQEIYQQLSNLARDFLKWEDITEEIWTTLEEKLSLPNSQTKENKMRSSKKSSGDEDWQDISKFSSETVESAFLQVEHIIEKANKDLEYIGQELDQLGQILIHYFGMVICWKILCYSYMNIYLQPIRDLEADKQQWKTTFVSQICSDSTKICENLAERVAKDYIRNVKQNCKQQMFTQEFLVDNFSHLKSIFTSKLIMLKTDQQIFSLKVDREDETFQDTFDNQIIAYIKDPKPFLDIVFEQEWKKATEQQISHSKQEYSKKVKKILKDSEQIVDELIGYFYRCQYKQKQNANDFFQLKTDNRISKDHTEQLDDMYRMAAFHYLQAILDGQDVDQNWMFQIKDQAQYTYQFFPSHSKPIALQQSEIFNSVQWTSEESNLQVIPFPVYFLEQLLEQIKGYSDSFEITYHDLGIADIYTDCRTQSIGCLKQCNFCGRKCDKPSNVEHKHGCEKTHQVRGMKGVRYGKTLSNKICDEIKMDQVLHVENNGKITKIKWGDICKNSCPDWNFMKENPEDKYVINFTDIWNKYAEFFCNYYRNFYQEELNFNFITFTQKYHYIICMDDSGSMYGQKWNNAKLACINFIKDSQKYHEAAQIEAKISVVKFSNVAKLVYGPEKLDYQLCQNQLNFEGGGTDFFEPLHIAIDHINQHRDQFNRHIIMMYTDGYARYPEELRKQLNSLPKDVYQSIEFKSWSEQDASVLSDIAKLFVVGEAQDNVKTDELGMHFCEILNAVQHGISF